MYILCLVYKQKKINIILKAFMYNLDNTMRDGGGVDV